ncbi:MAG: OmpH family outer membrane protein [Bacteroidota bacterium]|nr:OmpH family outer membrane protein [Bacteroidota bacterium]
MLKNLIIGVAFIAGIAGFVISLNHKDVELVYVDMGKLYDNFALTKELNVDMEKIIKTRKSITDSLYEDLRVKTQELKFKEKKTIEDIQKIAKIEEEYMYKQQQFEKENQMTSADYMNKIWNQINQFVEDYGTEKKYAFVLGANGQGNIMFGDKGKNVTTDVIAYINNRYNDKMK